MIKYICILDFEANCLENSKLPIQEIIEFPTIVYDVEKDLIDESRTFHYYCNTDTPITKFCTELTGITQDITNAGKPFKEVLYMHRQWMIDNNFFDEEGNSNVIFVTCGDWDLKTALPTQCRYSNVHVPKYLKEWCNIKYMFNDFYKVKGGGMKRMLNHLKLSLDGTHHSGIDDCRNIAKIVRRIWNDNGDIYVTGWK